MLLNEHRTVLREMSIHDQSLVRQLLGRCAEYSS